MNRKQKIIVSVTGIFLVLLLLVGLTYAYFLTQIQGNENTKSISVTTANLRLVYGDGNGVINATNIEPGYTLDEKTFTVSNEGNAETDYAVVIEDVKVTNVSTGETTTFESNDFVYTLSCTSDGEACNGVDTATTFPIEGGTLLWNSIEVGKTHTYSLIVTYQDTGLDQSADMNKKMRAKVNIADITTINPYNENKSSLAYNIINNTIFGKTGTKLVSTPLTKVAVETSGVEYDYIKQEEVVPISEITTMAQELSILFGDSEETACSGATSTSYKDTVGQYMCIYDGNESMVAYVKAYDESSDSLTLSIKTDEQVKVGEKVLSVAEDNLGTSYYYRGDVEDNYVDFSGMCWRIVRIEGDGTIKLILEDQDNTCSTSNGNWDIGASSYGSMSTSFNNWLTNTSGIDINKLKKDTWCLGNTTDSYDSTTGELLTGSSSAFIYDAYRRLNGVGTTPYATLKCDMNNYETYESYIGALTADEVVFAGGKVGSPSSYYLFATGDASTYGGWWTYTPFRYVSGYYNRACGNLAECSNTGGYGYEKDTYVAEHFGSVRLDGCIFALDEYFSVEDDTYNILNLRPSITLAVNTEITGGNGTKNNPYVVE